MKYLSTEAYTPIEVQSRKLKGAWVPKVRKGHRISIPASGLTVARATI